jgi:hypothetical protein
MSLPTDYRSQLREAVLDTAYDAIIGKQDNAVHRSVQASHDALDASDYDTDSVKESLRRPAVDRTRDSLTITWGWTHPAARYLNSGTSPHTINGDPILSFIWEDPPAWAREQFEQEGDGVRAFLPSVDVDGIDAIRFQHAGIRVLNEELQRP